MSNQTTCSPPYSSSKPCSGQTCYTSCLIDSATGSTFLASGSALNPIVFGHLHASIPTIEFLQRVCGIDRALATYILSGKWTLSNTDLQDYERFLSKPEAVPVFTRLIRDLAGTVNHRVNRDLYDLPDDIQDPGQDIIFQHEEGGLYEQKSRPDIVAIRSALSCEKPPWSVIRHFFQFKSETLPDEEDNLSDYDTIYSASHSSATRTSLNAPYSPVLGQKRNNCESLSPTSAKRRCTDWERDDADLRDLLLKVTDEEADIAVYALECLAASTRHYVTALWIDEFQITLWYFDRTCILRSEPFDFKKEPQILALVVYALSVCDDKHAGFDPYLAPIVRLPEPRDRLNLDEPWQDIVGLQFTLPLRAKYPGRGKYRIKGTLHRSTDLIGRGTMVYRVLPLVKDKVKPGHEVLKLSWPSFNRSVEAPTVEHLHSMVPDKWRKHLPEVTYSATLRPDALELPRVPLLKEVKTGLLTDRRLHVLGMKIYRKLWEARNAEEFMQIYLDCLQCHYYAYKDGKVLHRDLSENNLMFKYTVKGKVRGVLNDWDMTSYLEENGEIEYSDATRRTGTISFMACDLLVDHEPPPHLYRHDLESFFYILVWAAFTYDFGSGASPRTSSKGELHPAIADWNNPNYACSRYAKKCFIIDVKAKEKALEDVLPQCRPLLPWIESLWSLFYKAYVGRKRSRLFPDRNWDNNTLGGNITFERFMKALGR